MSVLTEASHEWMTRPADERFLSLSEMSGKMRALRDRSRSPVVNTRNIEVLPGPDHRTVYVNGVVPTHHAFSQICSVAAPTASPAPYFRESKPPAEIVADALNYHLRFGHETDVALLATDEQLRAVTSPSYGRVWNAEIVDMLIERFGDGVTGDWRVPGEFGKQVEVDQNNTTLYASDRDMFVFLADEDRRIEVPDRRGGRRGSLARGFFVWNSEVGDKTLGAGFFLFDYVCSNRMVWGAEQYSEIRIRHTKGAFGRWLKEAMPILNEFANGSPKPVQQAIDLARRTKIDELDQFLARRFGRGLVQKIKDTHEKEEGRPIETRWDVTVGATAAARSLANTDDRIKVERIAGGMLRSAA